MRRPAVQRLRGVAAGVELVRAVQPDVDEPGGDLLEVRPGAGRVGHHQRDVVRAQQREQRRVAEALVAHLQRVPQRPVGVGLGERAPVQPLVVPAASRAAAPVVRGSRSRNAASRSASKRIRGGSCHSTGPSFGPSASTPEAKKLASGVSTSRSCLRWVTKRPPLTANTKSVGRLGGPGPVVLRPLQRVERAVDLDAGHLAGQVLQLAPLRQPRRVERAAPRRVPPPRGADPDPRHGVSMPAIRDGRRPGRMSAVDPAVIITGAAGALGHAVVAEFLAAGRSVVALDRPGDRLDGLGRRARGAPGAGASSPTGPRCRPRSPRSTRCRWPRSRWSGWPAGSPRASWPTSTRTQLNELLQLQLRLRAVDGAGRGAPVRGPRRRRDRAGRVEDRGHRAGPGGARGEQGRRRPAHPAAGRRAARATGSGSTRCCRR